MGGQREEQREFGGPFPVNKYINMQATNTRLIVKNIPKHVDERRLRQHFSERGQVSPLVSQTPKPLTFDYRHERQNKRQTNPQTIITEVRYATGTNDTPEKLTRKRN